MYHSIYSIFILNLVSTITALHHIPVDCPDALSFPQVCFKLHPQQSESLSTFTSTKLSSYTALHKAQIVALHRQNLNTPHQADTTHNSRLHDEEERVKRGFPKTIVYSIPSITITKTNVRTLEDNTVIYRAFTNDFEEVFQLMPITHLSGNKKLFSRVIAESEDLWTRIVKFMSGKSYLVAQWESEEPLQWAFSVLDISIQGRNMAPVSWKKTESEKYSCALKSITHTEVLDARIHADRAAQAIPSGAKRDEILRKNEQAARILLNPAKDLDSFNTHSFEYDGEFEYWTTKAPYKTHRA